MELPSDLCTSLPSWHLPLLNGYQRLHFPGVMRDATSVSCCRNIPPFYLQLGPAATAPTLPTCFRCHSLIPPHAFLQCENLSIFQDFVFAFLFPCGLLALPAPGHLLRVSQLEQRALPASASAGSSWRAVTAVVRQQSWSWSALGRCLSS